VAVTSLSANYAQMNVGAKTKFSHPNWNALKFFSVEFNLQGHMQNTTGGVGS
jgi:hypothetical protein